jgi:cytochrome c-type biogenesis protein
MIDGIGQLVDSGPLLLAMPVAAVAGAITFLSPCCLPLVPGYLSYLTGMSGTAVRTREPDDALATTAAGPSSARLATAAGGQASTAGALPTGGAAVGGATASGAAARGAAARGATVSVPSSAGDAASAGPATTVPPRGRVVFGTFLFVLGFSAVFVAEAVALGSIGGTLRNHSKGLSQVLGVLIIALGLLFVGAFDRLSFSGRIFRPSFRPRAGLAGAPVLGVVFGLGWTPCIGPTLGAVLTLSVTTGTAARAGLLAFVYALGLGVPFLIVAFAFQRGINVFGFARRHARLVTQIGGVMLIAVGLLEVTGAWAAAVSWLQVHWINGFNPPI